MRLTSNKKEEKKALIIEAGLSLMKLHGFHGTSIKDITDEAKIPKGSFFNYFISKEEFTKELIDVYVEEALKDATKVLTNHRLTPINRIKRYFQNHIKYISQQLKFKEGCFINTMCQEMSDVNEGISKVLMEKIHSLRAPLILCIEEGQNEGSISKNYSAQDLAIFIDNAFRGTTVTVKTEKSKHPYEIFNNIISDLLQPSV